MNYSNGRMWDEHDKAMSRITDLEEELEKANARAEAAEARAEQLRVGLIEFRTYFLSWREDGFMDGDVEALIKVRDALKGGEG